MEIHIQRSNLEKLHRTPCCGNEWILIFLWQVKGYYIEPYSYVGCEVYISLYNYVFFSYVISNLLNMWKRNCNKNIASCRYWSQYRYQSFIDTINIWINLPSPTTWRLVSVFGPLCCEVSMHTWKLSPHQWQNRLSLFFFLPTNDCSDY